MNFEKIKPSCRMYASIEVEYEDGKKLLTDKLDVEYAFIRCGETWGSGRIIFNDADGMFYESGKIATCTICFKDENGNISGRKFSCNPDGKGLVRVLQGGKPQRCQLGFLIPRSEEVQECVYCLDSDCIHHMESWADYIHGSGNESHVLKSSRFFFSLPDDKVILSFEGGEKEYRVKQISYLYRRGFAFEAELELVESGGML